MPHRTALSIPPRLLILDAIGTLLLVLGIAEQFTGMRVWPAALQFAGDGIAIMVVGALLVLPMFLHINQVVTRRLEGQRPQN
jgi:hypothetical protein